MLVEFLRPLGAELSRRWLAALLMVHRDERQAIVESVERKIAELYPLDLHDQLASSHSAGSRSDHGAHAIHSEERDPDRDPDRNSAEIARDTDIAPAIREPKPRAKPGRRSA